jgi:hypothetical protein
MNPRTGFSSVQRNDYRDLRRELAPRSGYVLAVSAALAVVTFTLVYLTTLSFASGF